MSDFSAAIMFKAEHEKLALEYMEDDVFLIRLNDSWICRLSENDQNCATLNGNYSNAVLDLSRRIPLMHVMNAEDHCLELNILHGGESVCCFAIVDDFDDEYGCSPSMEYYEAEGWGIDADEIDSFMLFGFDSDNCGEILNALSSSDKNRWEKTATLFNILGINEFSFVSHHYLSSDKERGETHFIVIKW